MLKDTGQAGADYLTLTVTPAAFAAATVRVERLLEFQEEVGWPATAVVREICEAIAEVNNPGCLPTKLLRKAELGSS